MFRGLQNQRGTHRRRTFLDRGVRAYEHVSGAVIGPSVAYPLFVSTAAR